MRTHNMFSLRNKKNIYLVLTDTKAYVNSSGTVVIC